MKIQLKRSNVLENNAAKEPTAPQMEYGELAVNYNTDDPAIFIKDSNNNIIRIAGVNNISDDGQVEIPSNITPPSDPLPGNLWYNPVDGRLYVYYDDGNSQQWVDASPDNWNPSVIPDPDGGDNQSGTLDDRYVKKIGDNMTGDLTLGTDKITLNATDGSANFAGELNVGDRQTVTGGVQLREVGSISSRRDGPTVSGVYTVYNGGNDRVDQVIGFNNDGSAEFAGTVNINADKPTNNGYAIIARTDNDPGTNVATIFAQNKKSAGMVFAGTGSTGVPTTKIFEDGSATFAGGITASNTNFQVGSQNAGENGWIFLKNASENGVYMNKPSDNVLALTTNSANIGTTGQPIEFNATDGSATFAGQVTVIDNYYYARNSGAIFVGADSGGNQTSVINGDGSARFGSPGAGASNFGVEVYKEGAIYLYSDSSVGTSKSFKLINSSDSEVISFGNDGSADFAGNVKTDGYLWANPTTNQAGIYNYQNQSTGTISFEQRDTANTTIQFNWNGSATFAGQINGTTVGTSDARFKENITPANPQLADVVALGGLLKNYDWTDEAPVNEELRSVRQLGLVAQEVEDICPSLVKDINRTKTMEITPAVIGPKGRVITKAVTEEVDDSYKGLSQDALIMKLIGAVAELSAEVQALKDAA